MLLSGVYFAFPPIFADGERVQRPVVAQQPAEPGGPIEFQPLPDIPMTPSITAHRRSIELLEESVRRLREIPGYTANFTKEEVVGGEATGPQTMRLKLRHAPYSIYLRWVEGKPGQELLFVEGKNDGKMIVRAGGLKGILGAIKLDVDGRMARNNARHPVTEMGLLKLATSVLEYRYREASWTSGYRCVESEDLIDERPCHCFTLVYDSPEQSPEYRKSKLWIDKEFLVITKICNFGWPEEKIAASEIDEKTKLEEYTYTNLNFHPSLVATDFSAANDHYRLQRR